ncbi:LEAF RUST 10 DISEASE-RESISTANCE LOCUS RECEPTOR-LIKE PROTEIN KINASE-like 2.1 [Sesamum alatum]|uniref:LEAF RUST 10 DISEASE-RESISTANCE LOCUS RECEPTOR-LIKE PROTEIN KINASE-like 2.1 n=1 Tax=Sesamum alatum TaxID=300844 RepID=A0AAE1YH48_9LAMI|nr:LEAF RUST 10 DISEASE-RESISTANCE LOCUS RECEPTOR-LIKE PROTEIN KINASE-like 2.1 [Sesamum alatum]
MWKQLNKYKSSMNLAKCSIFFVLFHPFMLKIADSRCSESFDCGGLGILEFPLTDDMKPECGLFVVDCYSTPPRIQLDAGGNCSFTFSPNLTIFRCEKSLDHNDTVKVEDYFQSYKNNTSCELSTLYYKDPAYAFPSRESSIPESCSVIQMPVKSNRGSSDLFQMSSSVFDLEWTISADCLSCHHRRGKCLTNGDNEFLCAGGVTMAALTSTSMLLVLFSRRKDALLKLLRLQKAKAESQKDMELFLKNNGSLAPRRYKYSDLKKMTKRFSESLGKGGYGSVHKGKLPDGCLVAVKILNESKGKGDEFMNEVASISRTFHINIVSLLGFCFEGCKKALIYEFMPNGSLERFIQNAALSSAEAGGRKNIDPADVDSSSEVYFPIYIYKQLERLNGETDPKDRPSMNEVVEMLERKLESLQVPPKPYLSSPSILAPNSICPESFRCGNLGSLEFPYSNMEPDCGLLMVDKCDSEHPVIQLGAGGIWYDFLGRISENQLLIRDPILQANLGSQICSVLRVENLSLPKSPFISFTPTRATHNLTLFTCDSKPDNEQVQNYFRGYYQITCALFTVYYRNPGLGVGVPAIGESSIPQECGFSQVPVKPDNNSSELLDMLTAEFTIEWNLSEGCYECHRGGGQCLSNTLNGFKCAQQGNRKLKTILIIGGVTLSVTASIIFIFLGKKHKVFPRLLRLEKAKTENEKDIELFLSNHGNLAQKRYKYSDLKKLTSSFSENLGRGGYGNVYKGKLPDGRPVAVKILNESKENGQDFMNEVASTSRTSHVNIVSLLGFCFEGSKRALVYEFMPNGSLEKFIHNSSSSSAEHRLGWQKKFEIAVGIARGLDYLHQGCNTRILHFDIKPHNVLLDKDFNPKISDFGLAKLCPNRSSIVSMFVARGTIGYIAPEVFCRNFGEVSHKSDVYSYGMMVLEMVVGRQNPDRQADCSSETYFPDWIYKHLEVDTRMDLDNIENEDKSHSARKMMIVGLWCIQTDPKNRPSISRVVEMLAGSTESLQIPPKPGPVSPPRPAVYASTTSEPSM